MKTGKRLIDLVLIVFGVAVCVYSARLMSRSVFAKVAPAVTPLAVTVHVTVTNAGGGTLSYLWRSTDGKIVQANSPTTTWTLPNGPGLHFAYVLVSNGVGGYTERRVAVNTDTIGNPATTPSPVTIAAPAAGVPSGNFYRSFITLGGVKALNSDVAVPDVPVYLVDNVTGKHSPATGTVYTDLRGQFLIPDVPATTSFSTMCSVDGGVNFVDCTTNGPTELNIPTEAVTDYVFGTPLSFPPVISGHLSLQDGSPCGTVNEFFGVESTATATLLDAFDIQRADPVRVNQAGNFTLPYNSAATHVLLQCEGAAPFNVSVGVLNPTGVTNVGVVKLPVVRAPVVSTMTAVLGTTSVGLFLPPPTVLPGTTTALPSNIVPLADAFLAEKGLDTRIGACQYYKAIGAVTGCGASGNFTGSISFTDWQREEKMGAFATPGPTEYVAAYVNKVDLNLTRVHHSISYSSTDTAAYVCNHLGPTNDTQTAINLAVANAAAGKDLVACVAMDYSVHTGVNGNKPFVRFLIFGPSGQLLPSINLDGRREKFVPGTCVVCHGGDFYAGKFPENGKTANVGGHFVPYDTGNFEFSTAAGFTEAAQETAIYNLNHNILNAGPTAQETALVAGWYGSGKVLNKLYVPASWSTKGSAAISFYQNVVARSCRTCHAAMVSGYNFDNYANITPGGAFYRGSDASLDVGITVCGGDQVIRAHSMPNSLETFNRFWQVPAGPANQSVILTTYFGANVSPTGSCTKGLIP